jgi:hypothetical protein
MTILFRTMTNNMQSVTIALHHRSPHVTFSIRRVPMGPVVTHLWRLQCVIKVSALILSPCDVYPWDPSPSDLWDPNPVGPFSISIRPMGPDGLHVTYVCGPFSIWLVGLDSTFLHLHLTYGTQRFACHVYPWDHPTFGIQWLTCQVYLWDLSPSPFDLWDPMACMSLVAARV